MIVSTDKEKVLEKIQCAFLIKFLEDLRLKRTFFNIVKVMYKKFVVDLILNRPKLKQFLSQVRNETSMSTIHILFQYCAQNTNKINKTREGN